MKHTLYILVIISLMFCASCAHTKYITREIPVEVVKTSYQNVFVHDSIYKTDSIFVEIKGDTVTKEHDGLVKLAGALRFRVLTDAIFAAPYAAPNQMLPREGSIRRCHISICHRSFPQAIRRRY